MGTQRLSRKVDEGGGAVAERSQRGLGTERGRRRSSDAETERVAGQRTTGAAERAARAAELVGPDTATVATGPLAPHPLPSPKLSASPPRRGGGGDPRTPLSARSVDGQPRG